MYRQKKNVLYVLKNINDFENVVNVKIIYFAQRNVRKSIGNKMINTETIVQLKSSKTTKNIGVVNCD